MKDSGLLSTSGRTDKWMEMTNDHSFCFLKVISSQDFTLSIFIAIIIIWVPELAEKFIWALVQQFKK